jgi:hypothetical protein
VRSRSGAAAARPSSGAAFGTSGSYARATPGRPSSRCPPDLEQGVGVGKGGEEGRGRGGTAVESSGRRPPTRPRALGRRRQEKESRAGLPADLGCPAPLEISSSWCCQSGKALSTQLPTLWYRRNLPPNPSTPCPFSLICGSNRGIWTAWKELQLKDMGFEQRNRLKPVACFVGKN